MSDHQSREKRRQIQEYLNQLKWLSDFAAVLILLLGAVYLLNLFRARWTLVVMMGLGALLNGMICLYGLVRRNTLQTWLGGVLCALLAIGTVWMCFL